MISKGEKEKENHNTSDRNDVKPLLAPAQFSSADF